MLGPIDPMTLRIIMKLVGFFFSFAFQKSLVTKEEALVFVIVLNFLRLIHMLSTAHYLRKSFF